MQTMVYVYSKINPTEDPEKVEKAVIHIFPQGELEIKSDHLIVRGDFDCLENLKEMLEQRKIRSAAREIMQVKGDNIEFLLSKQAALVEVVNLVEEESPLGEIKVEITSPDPQALLDYLAPQVEENKKNRGLILFIL